MIKPLLFAIAAGLSLNAHAATFAYISSPADGLISQYRLDESNGALSLVQQIRAGEQVNPLAASLDGSRLYAALRAKPFKVLGYQIEPGSGHLKTLSEAPLADSLAYLSLDHTGRYLLGASYGADLVSIQPVDSTDAAQIKTYKTGLHAHSLRSDPSNRFAYAGNLGVDHVLQYRLDTAQGSLVPIGSGQVDASVNSGPRHLAFSPDGKFVYVVGEMSGSVTSYAIDQTSGALSLINEAAGIPERLKLAHGEVRDARNNDLKDDPTPRIWAADIRITPQGNLLFISERASSSVSVFKVDTATGRVSFLENYAVQEKQPRNIAVSPNGQWLLVSGEKSDTVGSYAIGQEGELKRVSEAPSGKGAVWIEMVRVPQA
ncbi:putative lactonase family protein [Pseudomonas sp. StFLB209]|uniref:lactonase family protein n=1 Tax=Pseudomonas sp. StFLB209 TaxID=1028989 RepID=UPI0004F8EC64|nr:lactonase family protein [Pseudomonas sp. StFLB209]BAP44703.1 putative lactonase family protein [Pseudomonas sp. StFLB209]